MKKINLMYLYSAKGFGGIVRNLSLIVNNLNKDIFDITVVSLANKGDKNSVINIAQNCNAKFLTIVDAKKLHLTTLAKIKECIMSYKIDILSCHGYKADIYGFCLARFFKYHGKLVTMKHGWVTPGIKFQAYHTLDKFLTKWFDITILVSEGQRKEIASFDISPHKTIVINNAIDSTDCTERIDRDSIRQRFNINKKDYVVGMVGRLSGEKDIKTALYAIAKLLRMNNNAKLIIVGEGPSNKNLMKTAKSLGIENNVTFLGYQRNVSEIYSIMDLYISCSLKEGLPNSVLEAQQQGVPCIVTDISGNNDIVKDGINGFLIKPKTPEILFKKILILMEDQKLAKSFVIEGQKTIKNKFSLEKRIKKLENLYYQLAGTISR